MGSSLGRWLAEQRQNRRAAGDRRAPSTVPLLLPALPRRAPPGQGMGQSCGAARGALGLAAGRGFIPRPAREGSLGHLGSGSVAAGSHVLPRRVALRGLCCCPRPRGWGPGQQEHGRCRCPEGTRRVSLEARGSLFFVVLPQCSCGGKRFLGGAVIEGAVEDSLHVRRMAGPLLGPWGAQSLWACGRWSHRSESMQTFRV